MMPGDRYNFMTRLGIFKPARGRGLGNYIPAISGELHNGANTQDGQQP